MPFRPEPLRHCKLALMRVMTPCVCACMHIRILPTSRTFCDLSPWMLGSFPHNNKIVCGPLHVGMLSCLPDEIGAAQKGLGRTWLVA